MALLNLLVKSLFAFLLVVPFTLHAHLSKAQPTLDPYKKVELEAKRQALKEERREAGFFGDTSRVDKINERIKKIDEQLGHTPTDKPALPSSASSAPRTFKCIDKISQVLNPEFIQ